MVGLQTGLSFPPVALARLTHAISAWFQGYLMAHTPDAHWIIKSGMVSAHLSAAAALHV